MRDQAVRIREVVAFLRYTDPGPGGAAGDREVKRALDKQKNVELARLVDVQQQEH